MSCKACNGSGVTHEYDEFDRISTFPCYKCDGSGESKQTNYEKIMSEMTVAKMAESRITEEYVRGNIVGYHSIASGNTYFKKINALEAEIAYLESEVE